MIEDLRVKISFFKQVVQCFQQKLYIHHWRPVCYFRDTNKGVKFGI